MTPISEDKRASTRVKKKFLLEKQRGRFVSRVNKSRVSKLEIEARAEVQLHRRYAWPI